MMKRCMAGGEKKAGEEEEGERGRWRGEQRDNLLLLKRADKNAVSSVSASVCGERWRVWLPQRRAEWHGWREVWLADRGRDGGEEGGVSDVETASADEAGNHGSPGARGVAGSSSRHGQAQRHRRLQQSQTATGVSEWRHFSLWRRREEYQGNSAYCTYMLTNTRLILFLSNTHNWIQTQSLIWTCLPFILSRTLSHSSSRRHYQALSWKIKHHIANRKAQQSSSIQAQTIYFKSRPWRRERGETESGRGTIMLCIFVCISIN